MTTADVVTPAALGLKVGDLVEVRSAEEIRATLDENGELDGLPFMPEMLAFCGRRLTVHKVAHKSCDYIGQTGHAPDDRRGAPDRVALRRLGARWLRERLLAVLEGAVAQARRPRRPGRCPTPDAGHRALLPLLVQKAQKEPFEDGEPRYSCQAHRDAARGAAAAAPEGPGPVPRRRHVRQRRRLAVVRSFLVAVFNRYQDLSKRFLPAVAAHPRRPALGFPRRVASSAVARRPSTSTSARASWSASSRARRSWRRWTPTC